MRVLLVGEISGTRDGQQWPPRGSIVDLPDDEAAMLCRHGMAKPAPEIVETATVEVESSSVLTTATGPGRRKVPRG